jgi:16S rRNA (cytosine1402-N4)-methyltransferase
MVDEVLKVLAPVPGDAAVDCTLGYGGHASAILNQILPGGRLLGVDADPIELPKAEGRLREKGFGPDVLQVVRSNFAGLPQAMQQAGFPSANVLLADLGVSSMQLDDPIRGFTTKFAGPLDMRMNPGHGQPASRFLERVSAAALTDIFSENADEPRAGRLAEKLAGKRFVTTTELTAAVRAMLPELDDERREMTVRRVFQALRIAVNEEFSALEALLRNLPVLLAPGGRVAILSFHSGEDRRVKKCFAAGRGTGIFAAISEEVVRPSAAEQQSNPRSTAAKLRWALRATS